MPYDPRMMMRGGVPPSGFAPDPGGADPNQWWTQQQHPQGQQFAPAPAPAQPKQWYEGLPPMQGGRAPQGAAAGAPGAKPPMSLLDMLMGAGKGTAPSSYGPIPGMGAASPWMYLSGLMGGGGGAGK